jgi:dTDP-4-dehydrorhamnose reductase
VRVLITGASGQLGTDLVRTCEEAGDEVVATDGTELDITDRHAVAAALADGGFDVVCNTAAWTAVDDCEADPERAHRVNALAPRWLASACRRAGSHLVHVSTDYVFDGTQEGWYSEDDPIRPLGAYGRTKAAGESAALNAARALVLRTAWVYSAHGANFVKTMLRLAAERDEIGVVDDQFGCPTSAADIAGAIVELVSMAGSDGVLPHRLYHVTAPDDASWHELATAIFEHTGAASRVTCRKLTTADYPTRAVRPANSRLDTTRLAATLGHRLPPWRRSLSVVLAELGAATAEVPAE